MRSERKKPTSDLRNYYTLFLQMGLVAVLLIFIVAMKMDFVSKKPTDDLTEEQEVTKMEEVVQTKQEKTPPPPSRPQVPVEVPNDEIVQDNSIDLNADMSMNEKLEMPPPPKEEEEEEDFFQVVENMPEPVGGIKALQKQAKYPKRAQNAGIEGRVTVQFIVNKDGNVENAKVMRGIGGGCDEEALRVVRNADFKPGRQRGKPVRVQFSVPITFKLQN